MACDSLYVAWLKVHYPYELYLTMLKLYDEKKNTDKISAIIAEMKRYKNIDLILGKWGQDNRDWMADKTAGTISQSLSSIKYMSKQAAQDLYRLSQQKEAEMGEEIVKAVLNKEGKAALKTLKAEYKQVREHLSEMSQEEIDEKNRYFETKENEIWNKDEFLESREQTIKHTAPLDCFTNVLRALKRETCLDTGQIKILIELGYFSAFGNSGMLMKVYEEFCTKFKSNIKSFNERLEALREYEQFLKLFNDDLPLRNRLESEQENIGICLTTDPNMERNVYFVRNVDEKWGTRVDLYSISTGKSGSVRFKRADIQKVPVVKNQIIKILDGNSSPRYTYKGGKRFPIPGEKEYWVQKYSIVGPN